MYKHASVTLMVSDFDRAVRFYTETLGLPLKGRYENEFAEVEAPGLNIGLHPLGTQEPEAKPRRSITLGLQVDDLEAAIKDLKGRGVRFTSDTSEDGFLSLIFFEDPDGYTLYLCQFNEAPSV